MKQQGVTLLQMMSALAVASLLTHLGAPAYAGFGEELRQAAVAQALAHSLRTARNQAALLQRAVLVQPLEADWGKGWRMLLEDNGQLLHEHRLARPARISASSRKEVRFSGRGAPLGAGFGGTTLAICQLRSQTSHVQVVLSPSGRVSLRSDEGRRCAGH